MQSTPLRWGCGLLNYWGGTVENNPSTYSQAFIKNNMVEMLLKNKEYLCARASMLDAAENLNGALSKIQREAIPAKGGGKA